MFALARLWLPTRPHHPPTPYRLNPRYYRHRKTTSKTWGIQIACRISYEILATYITSVVSLAWLYCTIRAHSIFKIHISRNTKCNNMVSFPISGHIYILYSAKHSRDKAFTVLAEPQMFLPKFLIISHRATRN